MTGEETANVVDSELNVVASREAERLAKKYGISIEELDRRLKNVEHNRDAQGLPQMSAAQVLERAKVDDFGQDVGVRKRNETGQRGKPEHGDDERRAERDRTLNAVNKRYVIGEAGQYFTRDSRDGSGSLAFADKGKAIKAERTDADTAKSMVDLAFAKGWDRIKVNGTPEFRSMVYREAEARGLTVRGHRPTDHDRAVVAERTGGKAADKDATGKPNAMGEVVKKIIHDKVADPKVRESLQRKADNVIEALRSQGKSVPTPTVYDPKGKNPDRANVVVDRNSERAR